MAVCSGRVKSKPSGMGDPPCVVGAAWALRAVVAIAVVPMDVCGMGAPAGRVGVDGDRQVAGQVDGAVGGPPASRGGLPVPPAVEQLRDHRVITASMDLFSAWIQVIRAGPSMSPLGVHAV